MFPEQLSGQPKNPIAANVFGSFLSKLLERKYPLETMTEDFIRRLETESGFSATDWYHWINGTAIPPAGDTCEALANFLAFHDSWLLLVIQFAENSIKQPVVDKQGGTDVGPSGSLTINSPMITPEEALVEASPNGKTLRVGVGTHQPNLAVLGIERPDLSI